MSYHINDKGEPGLCKVKTGSCPFGWEEAHFPSALAARAAYESVNNALPASKKKLPLVAPGEENPLLKEAKVSYKLNYWKEEPFRGRDGGRYLFLTVRGVNVAAVKIYEDESGPSLCDIETRPEYRNQGYGKKILEEVAALYGVDQVSHGGGYTPDGFNFISSHLKRATGSPPAEITFPEYNESKPFSIIEDWDSQTTKWDG